jgi:hypothetical protein
MVECSRLLTLRGKKYPVRMLPKNIVNKANKLDSLLSILDDEEIEVR